MAATKIGIFHATLPEPHRKPGGVEVFVDRLARHLHSRGHEVRCFSYSPRPDGARYELVRLRPDSWRDAPLARIMLVPWQLNFIDTSELDVLHLHGDDWFFLRRRLPTVRTFHGSAFCEAMHAERLKRRAGQLLAAPGELLASYLATASYGVSPGHPKAYRLRGTLSNGVAVPGEVPEERDEPPSIVSIGTWGGRKRGRLLYETFLREVRPRIPNAELWMVTDQCPPGPGVVWHEHPSDGEVRSLLQRAWAFCLPSTYEGFGIPYVEAMAAGVPVVATPNLGARHVLDGAGMIVREEELGPALVELLQDRALRARIRAAQRKRAQDFSWDRVITAHEAAYDEAIVRWRSRRRRLARRG